MKPTNKPDVTIQVRIYQGHHIRASATFREPSQWFLTAIENATTTEQSASLFGVSMDDENVMTLTEEGDELDELKQ
jgi:hypothetical protein